MLERNEFEGLAPQSKGRSEQPPPTEEEFEQLLDAFDVLGEYGPQMRALLRFLAFSLCRPGEAYGLEWSDINFDTNRIHVQRRVYRGKLDTPKSGKGKLIVLTPPARDALLTVPRGGETVCRSMRGDRLSATTVRRYWRDVCIKAGLDFDLYTSTKHYGCCSRWTKLDMSNRAIAAQAGWEVTTVDALLKVYGHGDVGALEEVERAAWTPNVVELRPVSDSGMGV